MHLGAPHLVHQHPTLPSSSLLPTRSLRRPRACHTRCSSSRASHSGAPRASPSSAAPDRGSTPAAYAPLHRLSDELVRLAQSPGVTAAEQGRALLEHLEAAPSSQLHGLPTSALASLLWALVRLQLEPSSQLLATIEREVLRPLDGASSLDTGFSDGNGSSSSSGGGGTGGNGSGSSSSSSRGSGGDAISKDSSSGVSSDGSVLPAGPDDNHLDAERINSHYSASSSGSHNNGSDSSVNSRPRRRSSSSSSNHVADGPLQQQQHLPIGTDMHSYASHSSIAPAQGRAMLAAPSHNSASEGAGTAAAGTAATGTAAAVAAAAAAAADASCRLMECDARDLSSFIYAFNFYKAGSRSFWVTSALAARQQLHALKPPAFVNLLASLAATGASADAAARAVFDDVATVLLQQPKLMRLCRPRDLASIVAAYATAGHVQVALFAAISNHLLHNKGQLLLGCRATDLVSIAWAYTHMGHTSHKLLATIARTLPARALRLEPPDASRVLWAYAVAGQVHRRMLTAVTEAVEGRMHLATPRVAASAVWSLAKLSFPAPAFVEAALDLIASCMEGAGGGWHGSQQQECLQPWEHEGQRQQPQEWQQPQQQQGGLHDAPSISDGALRSNSSSNGANMVQQALPGSTSGLVKASRQSSGTNSNGSGSNNSSNGTSILQQLYTGPPPSQHTASPRDVEQAVWAAGRLKHFNGALVAAVKRRLPALLPGMSDVGVVNVLWGFARLGYYSAAIVDPLCLEALQRLPKLSPQSVGTLAHSLASLRHYDEQLMAAIGTRAAADVKAFEHIDVVNVVCAVAELQHQDERLFDAMCKTTLRRMPDLSLRVLINILWAFAVAGRFDEALFKAGFKRLNADEGRNLHPLGLMQLFQAHVLLQDAYGGVVSPPTRLSAVLQAAAEMQWTRTAQHTSLSSFQQQLVAALQALGLQPQLEVLTRDGLFSIDIAVEWRGRRMAIEADGPSHFTISRPYCPIGSTVAKRRCLQARGYQVLSVPFYAWRRLGRQGQREQQVQETPGSGGGGGWADSGRDASSHSTAANGSPSSSSRRSGRSRGASGSSHISHRGIGSGASLSSRSNSSSSSSSNSILQNSRTGAHDTKDGITGSANGAPAMLMLEARMHYLKAALESAASMSPHALRADSQTVGN